MEHIVQITSLAYGGKGVGRIGGKVVFVPYTAPGDEARVEIIEEKKGFSEGALKGLVTPSPLRQAPSCGLYGVCGGCTLQHIGYAHQLEWKQKILEDSLKRIGGIEDIPFDPPAGSPEVFNYRSRARFQVEGGRWGFFEPRSHRVAPMDDCPLLDPVINDVFARIKSIFSSGKAGKAPPVFAVDIGSDEAGDKAVAAFHVTEETGYPWEGLLGEAGRLKGLEVWAGRPFRREKGERVLSLGDVLLNYEASGIRYGAGISVFSQVNRPQNRALMERVVEYSALEGNERVLDLFSGAGNLTLPIARRAGDTVGVEDSPEACVQASGNAALNSIVRVGFIASQAVEWLERNAKTLEKDGFDVVVLDPPRGGELSAARALSLLRPKKIIYVSCSPPTLARDISLLAGRGYRVARAGLFDMFPQTFHIESVIRLDLQGRPH
ncbi:MAG: class I SAM-dependent RNA methyltransferase [Deltaproteobacteria bacterium]|nr:class I SAM-dependent RNA methyltransferase [Deltaproteobacteria bacterium]